MCKVSDKSEMVGEIIGWFDMELPHILDVETTSSNEILPLSPLPSILVKNLCTKSVHYCLFFQDEQRGCVDIG